MMPGVLYVVATPIGNLEDITVRALRILRESNLIACEDTRQTRKLLDHFGISKPMVSYHDHNESSRTPELIERLQSGETIALVSDAGTPLISDPGYRVVSAAIAAGITVTPIPGPSAILTALAASGLATDSFRFCGFLPPKTQQRQKLLETLKHESATLVFYEAPHRIVSTLDDVIAVMGDREVVIARELTKLHEEFLRAPASEARSNLSARPAIKGEIVLLIAKSQTSEPDATPIPDAVHALEQQGVHRMEAIKQVAKSRGLPKRDVYRTLTS
jgi:16S rRNA (cytidine1402-2'-O)-methyltransferase